MFDALREYFEIILIGLFLISAVTYGIYRMTFYRSVKADLHANAAHLKSLSKKERRGVRHNILSRHLNSFSRKIIYFFADLFWVLLFVVVVRSFLIEPFVIPSGSMKPGLQIRDIVIVNKYSKGLRMPITNTRLTEGEAIKRGDVLVFKYPNNPKISYIKRVIGLPGDKIDYDNRKQMVINGKAIEQKFEKTIKDTMTVTDINTGREEEILTDFSVYQVDLSDKPFDIQYSDKYPTRLPPREWVVPEGKYLMMGDNRDDSSDGRFFGYLDDKWIIGKANRILFNWGCFVGKGKCDRFFKKIQ